MNTATATAIDAPLPEAPVLETVAIIQARMGSARLPGKVLMSIGPKSMLHHVIDNTLVAIKDIIVATTTLPEDNVIVEACKGRNVRVFRGHPTDVLSRYIEAAKEVKAQRIVRITGDCPMINPRVIADVVLGLTKDFDYSSNLFPRSFPKGFDCEAMWFDVLLRLNRISKPEEREHVTAAIARCRESFRITNLMDAFDPSFNWSVDTAEDLDRVRKFHALGNGLVSP